MYKKLLVGMLFGGVLCFGSPLVSTAVTVAELQQQVQSLLDKITQLQQQIGVRQQEHNDPGAAASAPPHVGTSQRCYRLNRALLRGMSGDDVRTLQEELKTRGLFSGDATGFFGPLTEQAVQALQRTLGIVSGGDAATTGYGIVGPLTQRGLWVCDDIVVNGALKATPQVGAAPLAVSFETRISGFHVGTDTYTIEYGDEASEPVTFCNAPADACQDPGVNMHTYTTNGVYVARLIRTHDECANWTESTACTRPVSRQELGRARIAVGIPATVCPEIAYQRPICAAGEVAQSTETPDHCPGPWQCVLKTDTTNKAPIISSFSGPTALTPNTQGTWTVAASDPENDQLSYNVRWGDEGSFAAILGLSGEQSFVQQTTFTHSYARAGMYVVAITVRDAQGKSARTTTTVRVGTTPVVETGGTTTSGNSGTTSGGVCAEEYAPVCGLKPLNCGNMNATTCLVSLRDVSLVTYGNRCRLQAAGATYLRAGTCPAAGAFGIVCWAPGSESTTTATDAPFAEGEHTQRVRLEGGAVSTVANYVCHNGRWDKEPPGTPVQPDRSVSQETTNQIASVLASIEAILTSMRASLDR